MRLFTKVFIVVLAMMPPAIVFGQPQYGAPMQDSGAPNQRAAAEQIFALANGARTQAGVRRLQWDPALADAALQHCRRMAIEGPIAHRYGGEADLSGRAAQAGAHFSMIEENVAVGPSADVIHQEWMQSPGHRTNLLSPDVDHVGVAAVSARGVLYAVADYSRAVQQMSASQVEAKVAVLISTSGVAVLRDSTLAREACATDEGVPHSATGMQPRFVMRWQDADLKQLPQALVEHLASGRYRQAAVGSCPAQVAEGSFSAYRVAVLLY